VNFPEAASGIVKEVRAMAAKAFVLIETTVGKTKEVEAAIERLKGVTSVDMVTGPYDIIVIVQGKNLNDIGDLVTGKIHPIAGIARTVTCLAI
jgi:DNA-binding Lrp family transcriptional regulator